MLKTSHFLIFFCVYFNVRKRKNSLFLRHNRSVQSAKVHIYIGALWTSDDRPNNSDAMMATYYLTTSINIILLFFFYYYFCFILHSFT